MDSLETTDDEARTSVTAPENASLATTAASTGRPPTQHQAAQSDADRVCDSLGMPSRKRNLNILDVLLLVFWTRLAIAVIAITPRLNVA